MKITEIEGYETLATNAGLEDLKRELKLEMRELRAELKEFRADIKEQFQRIRILIWLPVITGAVQIVVLLLSRR